ncbi:DIP1984 family protein [Psychrobacter okhotskensis]|uniref:DIP1984 family protein n=1 Tax=Psychrobacter okhotskensis TaxID=212403 RepID=UPI00156306AF|nr:DIP1984 family protein [Psychrobacter okhotskensis]NRD70288.1 DIP1984 family protein [Psychrobacter okhotskensis]
MKLAEALLIRSDMQKKLAQLKGRIRSNVKVQDGDTPSEDPNELMIDASQIISELSNLIERIHRTNAIAKTDKGQSILTLLVERDTLEMRHKLLIEAIEATDTEVDRYSHREIKWNIIVSVAGLQKQADDIAMKLRKINIVIQSNNWQIDLVE